MAGAVEVGGGVAVGRAVATADVSTRHTHTEMHPPAADRETVLASVAARRHISGLVEVAAGPAHVVRLPRRRGPRPERFSSRTARRHPPPTAGPGRGLADHQDQVEWRRRSNCGNRATSSSSPRNCTSDGPRTGCKCRSSSSRIARPSPTVRREVIGRSLTIQAVANACRGNRMIRVRSPRGWHGCGP